MPNRLSPSSMAASLSCGNRLQHDREQPRGAGEVALPERMAGIGGKGRVDHPRNLRPFRQPARKLDRRLLMARQPHAEAAQAPQAEIDILRPDAEPKIVMRLGDRAPRSSRSR